MLTFGRGGPHQCLGAHLARLELRVYLEELVARVDRIELAGEPVRQRSNFTNGLKRLPVRVTLGMSSARLRAPRFVLVLSENWTMRRPRDLRALVRIAAEAEDAGIDGGDAERAHRARRQRRAPGPTREPARLRGARQPGSGDSVARLDRPDERDRRGHDQRCG